nr:sigma-70 family RNA polymerase sigma factor [uncultured Cupriavidus sp.]
MLVNVAQGDQQAFASLYRHTSSKLFGVCRTMLRNQGDAEDVLQEVYAIVWRQACTFEPARASAMTWLIAVARNRSIDRLRLHREDQLDEPQELGIEDDRPTPALAAEQSQERVRLERCLDELPSQQKHAVREAFFSGATYAELAERLGVPLGTMKSWIRRSLTQLKACLER